MYLNTFTRSVFEAVFLLLRQYLQHDVPKYFRRQDEYHHMRINNVGVYVCALVSALLVLHIRNF